MSHGEIGKSGLVLSIDAGGTFFKSALIDASGEIMDDSFYQVESHSHGEKKDILAAYESVITASVRHAAGCGEDICGIGVATPGPFDYAAGMSLMKHKFQAMLEVPLRDEFRRFGFFPADMPIWFMHDVHAFLLGEQWNGAISGVPDAAAVTLGTGLGFGMMNDGMICYNGKGGPSVSLFNRPYKNGILEDVISRRGIINRYMQYSRSDSSRLDVHEIAGKACSGDPVALKVFVETGEILAGALEEILAVNEISSVVFGGQISKSFDLFAEVFEQRLASGGRAVWARKAFDMDLSPLKGAARMVMQPQCV